MSEDKEIERIKQKHRGGFYIGDTSNRLDDEITCLIDKISKLEKVREAAKSLQIAVKENIYESKAMVSLKDYEDLNNDLGKALKESEEKE